MSPLAAPMLHHDWAFSVLAITSLVIELGAPLALLHRRIAGVWALAAWGFHLGVVALMAILFPYRCSASPTRRCSASSGCSPGRWRPWAGWRLACSLPQVRSPAGSCGMRGPCAPSWQRCSW
jgi:hypothetical protein